MTTSLMPIYSIEIGDTLVIHGNFYEVVDTDYVEDGDDLVLTLVDEEGNRKRLTAPGTNEVNIVVSEYV